MTRQILKKERHPAVNCIWHDMVSWFWHWLISRIWAGFRNRLWDGELNAKYLLGGLLRSTSDRVRNTGPDRERGWTEMLSQQRPQKISWAKRSGLQTCTDLSMHGCCLWGEGHICGQGNGLKEKAISGTGTRLWVISSEFHSNQGSEFWRGSSLIGWQDHTMFLP